jgi:VNT family MFS transporter (synaptic vesicle glycoprotein 2)
VYCEGFGRVQIELVFAIMLVLINVFSETMGISNLIPAAECDLQLTSSTKGILSSMAFFGIMVSGYMWGYLGDTQGRRWVMLWSLLFSTIFTVISTFVTHFGLFLACRFMTGVL